MANPHPRPFLKTGADANPNGRPPKEWTWSGLLKEKMEELGPDKRAVKEAVAASLLAKALEGDVVAIKEIGNRIEGLPKQVIEQNGTLDVNLTSLTEEQLDEIIRQKSRKAGVIEVTGGEAAQN